MKTNLPVTQREYEYPADHMLVSMTDTKGIITHCNHAFVETSGFKREEELLHQFREKIKLRPELRVLAPGSLPPQIRPIEDKRHWD